MYYTISHINIVKQVSISYQSHGFQWPSGYIIWFYIRQAEILSFYSALCSDLSL